jgi:hypothetical protein
MGLADRHNEFLIKPYSLKELPAMYGVYKKIFKKAGPL